MKTHSHVVRVRQQGQEGCQLLCTPCGLEYCPLIRNPNPLLRGYNANEPHPHGLATPSLHGHRQQQSAVFRRLVLANS